MATTLSIIRWDDKKFICTARDESNTVINLTGYTVTMTIRLSRTINDPDNTTAVFSGNGTITDAVNGVFEFDVGKAITRK